MVIKGRRSHVVIQKWLQRQRKRFHLVHANHPIRAFWSEHEQLANKISSLNRGSYPFGPMRQLSCAGNTAQLWRFWDRLFIHYLYLRIKPCFPHIISASCYHLKGPSTIKTITQKTYQALSDRSYRRFCRLDIASYYASINHDILIKQIKSSFDDPLLIHYLSAIITTAIDKDGCIFLPTQGIPRGSSLSPFFGALYLTPLDRAFENKKGGFYVRYMDDILIFTETARQYRKVRKTLFKILKSLKLSLSRHKSCFGKLAQKTFHYLGVHYDVTRIHPRPRHSQVRVRLHSRTHQRALDKHTLINHAVNPATSQRYLARWATWWHHLNELSPRKNLTHLLSKAWEDGAWHAARHIPPLLDDNRRDWLYSS